MLPSLSGHIYPRGYFRGSCSFSSPAIGNLALKSCCMGARAPVCLGMFQVINKNIILLYSLLILLLSGAAILVYECVLEDAYI